jgi:hypothetical protein
VLYRTLAAQQLSRIGTQGQLYFLWPQGQFQVHPQSGSLIAARALHSVAIFRAAEVSGQEIAVGKSLRVTRAPQ